MLRRRSCCRLQSSAAGRRPRIRWQPPGLQPAPRWHRQALDRPFSWFPFWGSVPIRPPNQTHEQGCRNQAANVVKFVLVPKSSYRLDCTQACQEICERLHQRVRVLLCYLLTRIDGEAAKVFGPYFPDCEWVAIKDFHVAAA